MKNAKMLIFLIWVHNFCRKVVAWMAKILQFNTGLAPKLFFCWRTCIWYQNRKLKTPKIWAKQKFDFFPPKWRFVVQNSNFWTKIGIFCESAELRWARGYMSYKWTWYFWTITFSVFLSKWTKHWCLPILNEKPLSSKNCLKVFCISPSFRPSLVVLSKTNLTKNWLSAVLVSGNFCRRATF